MKHRCQPYALFTPKDLQYLAAHPEGSYCLMADLDLSGLPWIPVAFTGTLEGNGKTLSHLTVSQSQDGLLGLFSQIAAGAQVRDLHLREVSMTADPETRLLGTLAGSLAGTATGCTVTGIVRDRRPTGCPTGVLVGMLQGPQACLTGGTALTLELEARNRPEGISGLCADVLADLADPRVRVGLAGAREGGSVTGLWRDRTNDSALLPPEEQARRERAAETAHQFCSVRWTPREDMTFTPVGGPDSVHYQEFHKGQTYVGTPYSGHNCSLSRFLYCMEPPTEGVHTLKEGMFSGADLHSANPSGKGFHGFALYMGSDCSSVVAQAWYTVSPSRVKNADGSSHGGVYPVATRYMIPTPENQEKYGILPVGDYDTDVPCLGADDLLNYYSTEDIFQKNGAARIGEAYALAHKGDALLGFDFTSVTARFGHARMLARDPVILRDGLGNIDLKNSCCITHEQGDGLYGRLHGTQYDSLYTSCRPYYCYCLDALLHYESYQAAGLTAYRQIVGSPHRYVPITMAAYKRKTLPALEVLEEQPVTAPNKGSFRCNYYMVSAGLTILNCRDQVVHQQTRCNCVSPLFSVYRSDGSLVSLDALFADFSASALEPGTYRFRITLTASDGRQFLWDRGQLRV